MENNTGAIDRSAKSNNPQDCGPPRIFQGGTASPARGQAGGALKFRRRSIQCPSRVVTSTASFCAHQAGGKPFRYGPVPFCPARRTSHHLRHGEKTFSAFSGAPSKGALRPSLPADAPRKILSIAFGNTTVPDVSPPSPPPPPAPAFAARQQDMNSTARNRRQGRGSCVRHIRRYEFFLRHFAGGRPETPCSQFRCFPGSGGAALQLYMSFARPDFQWICRRGRKNPFRSEGPSAPPPATSRPLSRYTYPSIPATTRAHRARARKPPARHRNRQSAMPSQVEYSPA